MAKFFQKLERRLRPFFPQQITLVLIALQVLTYVVTYAEPERLLNIVLIPSKVLEGEWWRLITFVLQPPVAHPIFAFFFWYMWYLMGSALEAEWGNVRYNVFLLIGYVATVGVSFLFPTMMVPNTFLEGSVFLAFAWIYPDFELRLFFLLPVKIKWLALLAWVVYFWTLAFGDWPTKLLATAAVLNFLVFFGRAVFDRARYGHRRMVHQREQIVRETKPFHTCAVCGITDKSHPEMEFRYCSQCTGGRGYCSAHLRDHEHA